MIRKSGSLSRALRFSKRTPLKKKIFSLEAYDMYLKWSNEWFINDYDQKRITSEKCMVFWLFVNFWNFVLVDYSKFYSSRRFFWDTYISWAFKEKNIFLKGGPFLKIPNFGLLEIIFFFNDFFLSHSCLLGHEIHPRVSFYIKFALHSTSTLNIKHRITRIIISI